MIPENIKKQIITIWESYISSDRVVQDVKGNILYELDEDRLKAIEEIKQIIEDFFEEAIDIHEFKTDLDSYNKQNNLWGFTAVKGQMFFNQLVRTADENIEKLTNLIKETIKEPKNLQDALNKIESLEKYCEAIFSRAKDKRKAPNPKSVGYFLSYFWQIYNHQKWPILYSSIIVSFTDLGLWKESASQKEAYEIFYNLNEEVKAILKQHSGKEISNWDAEHSFWNFRKVTSTGGMKILKKETSTTPKADIQQSSFAPNFELKDYLIPRVARLVELGNDTQKSGSAKGNEFEKMVAEVFKLLDFEVEILGQGSGRNPDAIIKFREGNTAFIVDAKAYGSGYSLGLDDRAIKEYINYYCPKLIKDGYKKIGFIIVSNSFKTNLEGFINEITWNTDIKRFILLTSEALLYLLAYKTKDKYGVSAIIESLIGFGNIVTSQNIIEEFEDI
jgi:hypothetical protein